MREEIRSAMQKMSEQELREVVEMATKMQTAAHERILIEGGRDILEKWKQLLACVARVQRQAGTCPELWIDASDWSEGHSEGEIIELSKYLDTERYTFDIGYHEG